MTTDETPMHPTIDRAFKRDVYKAIGWFFAEAYLNHPDKIESVAAIVDLYRANQRGKWDGR